ncbi:RagB/SusD family nutrient uptake outer membrane protein [Flavisolibacter ginsenosidimutans]|uniref:RagB/SusD family nutrient uptake outer membrane protein n=1 Tax=Flavisolibacter ginsenosidimutans TaxID=661481 RepID=A0A5B8UKK3_9BACT|nr:RagB/SusD family nutrient uptake outer membrane protein [Flavisolibacter ginsenosidimutans]QEC57221.1 RagB/SusD family nutrient uptake outer membrane protein [Flavisolibacter ginsenosidimutans]
MKKILLYTILIFLAAACKKSSLELTNPNAPTPDLSLTTEAGLQAFSLGVLQRMSAFVPNEGQANIYFIGAMAIHSALGDEVFQPYGNFSIRWVNQPLKITLPSGQVVVNPNGVDQKTQLQGFNSRDAGELNSFLYEWSACYYIITQCNQLLKSLNDPALSLSGDAATKKNTFKAWALWWKGYAYSRIGSQYLAAVINNEVGMTNNNFVAHDAVVQEGNRILNDCLTTLNDIQPNADYVSTMKAIVAAFDDNQNIVTPDMWKRQIYTIQARNLLVNKKLRDMTAADWQQILTLAAKGIQASDNIFKFGMDPNAVNDVSAGGYHPYAFIGDAVQYTFVSERLIQDFKPGDKRFTQNFTQFSVPKVNIRGRGLQLGTRWQPIAIEAGGRYATSANKGFVPWACSYEENELMKAEAFIKTGSVQQGLQIVDAIRDYQGAGLAHVANTGLSATQAYEELRRERRIALFLWGTAWYDARRWGVTEPASQGGGRAGAIVLVPGDLLSPPQAAPAAVPCFIDYSYMDYWDVPQNEIDFNVPSGTSVRVKN